MAQKVSVLLVDDLDSSEAAETVVFGLDGASYEVDLSASNADKLRGALASFIGVARRTGGRSTTRAPRKAATRAAVAAPAAPVAKIGGRKKAATKASSSEPNTSDVRAWARDNGYAVSERGRLSADLLASFKAAQ